MDQKAIDIIRGMKPWYGERRGTNVELQDMRAEATECRTHDQIIWDHAILAAAEFVRRRLNFDDKLALEIHGLLSAKLPRDV